jgi:PAS domain S-box-containing protein
MNVLLVKDEGERSQDLEQYEAPSSAADPILDDLAGLAAQICETPLAIVCLVGAESLDVRAALGIRATNLALESTPCGVAMLGETIYEIPDTRLDAEFAPNGIVLEGQSFYFYAAAPLTTSDGASIGTLAVLDSHPRRLTEVQANALATLSRQVMARIEGNERIRQMEDICRSQVDAELTLRESEARYRQLIEGSLGIVFTHDLNGRLLSLNAHGAAMFGRSVEEVIGLPLEEFVPAKRRISVHEYLETLAAAGEAQGLLHLAHTDGDVRVIAYRNRLITVPEREPYVLGFGVDITERVHAERKLRTLTRQSNSILESVGDGIFCIDLAGRVTVVNTAAAQMLGYKQEEMLGKVVHPLIHHTRADGTAYPEGESPIRRSLSNFGTTRVRDEIFWRKDGTCFPVEYVARPLIDSTAFESGETRALGVVVAFTDTTERKALDRMKDEFISTVSHELRTPLTSLRGALGLLQGGALEARPEKSQQMLEIAINNADRLVRLVNDILDLERISSGKSELHLSSFRADKLLHDAVDSYRDQIPGMSSRIIFTHSDISVWADAERILQVLQNLLSNAIKFSAPDGKIYLTARRLDDQEALFEVRDDGCGIPLDKLEHIFDRFQQADASDSRALGGTGLGLTICRRIVNQHGGHIWATSTLGEGTTVHFTLPTKPRTNLR